MRGAVVVVVCSLAVSSRADACVIAPVGEHTTDAAEAKMDTTAPGKVGEITATVERGGTEDGGCSGSGSDSCGGIGIVGVHPTPPEDDRSSAGQLGYLIQVRAGEAPMGIPAVAIRPFSDGFIALAWDDPGGAAAIDFTIVVQAVDRAGNVGPESEPVRITDAGAADDVGCHASGGGRSAVSFEWLLVALVAVGLCRRRGAPWPRCSSEC
jgi:hypothetical protein